MAARWRSALALLALLLLARPTAQARPAAAPGASPVQHVVVLMLENRSFDHLLGFLKLNDSRVDGCVPSMGTKCGNPVDPLDPNSPWVYVEPNALYVTPVDPVHSYNGTSSQVYGYQPVGSQTPDMDGFVFNYNVSGNSSDPASIMSCFDPADVPALAALATEFGFFQTWHSDVPGPTESNRLFSVACTSNGSADVPDIALVEGFGLKSVFEMIDGSALNRTWKSYFEFFPTAAFVRYVRQESNWGKLHSMQDFLNDAAQGTLPSLSWVEPRYYDVLSYPANDMHPDHDVALGDQLVAQVYEALRNGPDWNSTVLLVTWDEHGGFMDHVPPPVGVPNPDGLVDENQNPPFNFDRLGVRVPAILVSPYVPRGLIVGAPAKNAYSHSSISATIRQLLVPDMEPLTARDAWSAPFGDLLSLETPRGDCPTTLPVAELHRGVTPGLVPEELVGTRPLTGFQLSMVLAAAGTTGVQLTEADLRMTEQEAAEFVARQTSQLIGRPVVDFARVFGHSP